MKKIISLLLCLVMVSCVSLPVLAAAEESAEDNVEVMSSLYWFINANNVNFRTAPNGGYLGLVHKADEFNNLGLEGPVGGYYWRHCHMISGQNSGKTGYVANQYCTSYRGVK